MAILMDFQALFVWTLEQPFSGHSNPCHMISGIGHCDERREIFFRRFASNAIEALAGQLGAKKIAQSHKAAKVEREEGLCVLASLCEVFFKGRC